MEERGSVERGGRRKEEGGGMNMKQGARRTEKKGGKREDGVEGSPVSPSKAGLGPSNLMQARPPHPRASQAPTP